MKLILFDGVCNLCNGFVQFIIKRDPEGEFKFASLQSDFAKDILHQNGVQSEKMDSVLFYNGNHVLDKSDAVLAIAGELRSLRWLRIFSVIPKPVRNFFYDKIAQNRYRIFGRKAECMIPTPELKSRFPTKLSDS